MRPCEFLRADYSREAATLRTQAFELCHIRFTLHNRTYQGHHAAILNDESVIADISDVSVLFTEQKNGHKGEVITQRATSSPHLCPVRSMCWIVRHLRAHGAEPATPIFAHHYNPSRQWRFIRYSELTNGLRLCASLIQSDTGVPPYLLSAKGLRPGGASALLCAGVDNNAIAALGRWRSDAMLTCLRPQAVTALDHLSARMVEHGSYTFTPGAHMLDQLPNEASPALHAAQAEHLRQLEQASARLLQLRAQNQPAAGPPTL